MSNRLLSGDGEVTTFDPRAPRKFWLTGGAAMCACPDCGAPMTIRLWLRMADCWKCGCSVELSAEQERQIQNLLRGKRTDLANSESVPQPSIKPPTVSQPAFVPDRNFAPIPITREQPN